MDQGQLAPPAQPATAMVPPVLPDPLLPLLVVPPSPSPPAFALGPGHSHAILNFDDPNTGAMATKLYNKAISLLEAKFDREANNLAVLLTSVQDRARQINWHQLISILIDDGMTRNLSTHYGQVSLDNTRTHTISYVNMTMWDTKDNNMF